MLSSSSPSHIQRHNDTLKHQAGEASSRARTEAATAQVAAYARARSEEEKLRLASVLEAKRLVAQWEFDQRQSEAEVKNLHLVNENNRLEAALSVAEQRARSAEEKLSFAQIGLVAAEARAKIAEERRDSALSALPQLEAINAEVRLQIAHLSAILIAASQASLIEPGAF